jgi:hypothetical protein
MYCILGSFLFDQKKGQKQFLTLSAKVGGGPSRKFRKRKSAYLQICNLRTLKKACPPTFALL